MSTEIKRDIFKSPFLELDLELWKQWSSGGKAVNAMSKDFDFVIVSQTKDGTKEIIWFDPDVDYNHDLIPPYDLYESQRLFMDYNWNELYVWDIGSARLITSENEEDVILCVDRNSQMEYPNVFISSPLIYKIYLEVEALLKSILSDAQAVMTIRFDNLFQDALIPKEKEIWYRKKDEI